MRPKHEPWTWPSRTSTGRQSFTRSTRSGRSRPGRTVTRAQAHCSSRGKYPIEQYAQTPVRVCAGRLDTLIDAGTVPAPELLWIDLQGAELAALRGLGRHLGRVGLVYVELSFLDIYDAQPVARDVIRFLRRAGFRIAAVPWKGTFQCEALFVNVRRLGPMERGRALIRGLGLERKARAPG